LPKLLTQPEYAAHRKERGLPGKTRQAVNKKVKTGAIPTVEVDGKHMIDPVAADAAWDANTQRTPSSGPGPDTVKPPADDEPAGDKPQNTEALSLTRARTVREGIQAQRAKVELDRLRGKLLPTDKVVDSTFEIVRIARDRLRGLPAKLAPRLVLADSPQECQEIVSAEVNAILKELSRTLSGIADAARDS